MQTAVRQRFGTQNVGYQTVEKIEVEKMPKYQSDFSVNGEHVSPNYIKIPIDREKILQSIAFLRQYMDDLKAGKPVENISPSNDPHYLIPENIAAMIERDKSFLKSDGKVRVFNSLEDIVGEWNT